MSGRRLFWVVAPLWAALLALQVERADERWRASRVAAVVKGVTVQASQRGLLTRQLLEHSVALVRRAEPESPVDVALPIARGSLYLLLERPKAAIRAYEEALLIEPRGEIYAHLGRAWAAAGDRAAADRAFDLAVLLDHNQRRPPRQPRDGGSE